MTKQKIIEAYAHDYRDMAMSEEELAKMLTLALDQAIAEREREILEEIEKTFSGCACGFHGYLVLPNCETNDHAPEKCARCILNSTLTPPLR